MSLHSNITPHFIQHEAEAFRDASTSINFAHTKKCFSSLLDVEPKELWMDHKVNHDNLWAQIHFKANTSKVMQRIEERSCHKFTTRTHAIRFLFLFNCVLLMLFLLYSGPIGHTVFAYIGKHSNWFVLIVQMLQFLPRLLFHIEFFQLIVHQLTFPVRVLEWVYLKYTRKWDLMDPHCTTQKSCEEK